MQAVLCVLLYVVQQGTVAQMQDCSGKGFPILQHLLDLAAELGMQVRDRSL